MYRLLFSLKQAANGLLSGISAKSRRGQTTVEFTVATGVILSLIVLLSAFLYVFKEYGSRIIDLIASEYP